MKPSQKPFIYSALSLLSFSAFADKQPSVWIEDNIIFYSGELSNELNENLFQLYAANKGSVDLISIESKGGEINTGLDLGNFVYENKLNIKVTSYCLSSCANYVFTAGHIKYVEGDTVIGFHGGAASTRFDMSQLDALPKSERVKFKKQLEDYLATTIARETEFFNKTGVKQKITTYGQDGNYPESMQQDYAGWYYSKESLEKLGVKNIVVNAPNWQPKQLSENAKLFKIDVVGI